VLTRLSMVALSEGDTLYVKYSASGSKLALWTLANHLFRETVARGDNLARPARDHVTGA
jgi:hypothetical protein